MEVHHHPDLHHQPKKWREYFLEFLMIFLAVTLGFIAESIREKINDHTKEKEYMSSMIQDLQGDTAIDAQAIKNFKSISKEIDTLLMCLKRDEPNASIINNIISDRFWEYSGYSYNNRTIQELKNAGNFRLIRNDAVSDSILDYDNFINSILVNQYNDLKNTMYAYKDVESKVFPYKELKKSKTNYGTGDFDSSDFIITDKPTFISGNKELLSQYYNRLFIHEELCHTFIRSLKHSSAYAARLIKFIQKEYHLDSR
ncbi:MAG TPA: hypothetical protein VMU83_12350 [Hanamia sp.]|nr:hypothetical protein [Hanamia sp.]